MTCRNQQNGRDFRKTISKLTAQDFQDAAQNPDSSTNTNAQRIVKSITTKCNLVVIPDAAQDALKRQFAMMDPFGLTSLFFTITPYDNVVSELGFMPIQTTR